MFDNTKSDVSTDFVYDKYFPQHIFALPKIVAVEKTEACLRGHFIEIKLRYCYFGIVI
ncbi:MAG: hypothetical protein K0S75_946, partial [Clostridia bacterium]|nr:hypothetical protein [Clostridia bacterium]